jgi:hypothetical protein
VTRPEKQADEVSVIFSEFSTTRHAIKYKIF